MAAFDPYQIAPDWTAQKKALANMYQQGLINLNAKKGNLMSQYGFLNTPDYTTSGNVGDFSNLQVDANQEYGAYRNELRTEADALDAADNGPDRGFGGGLANQAKSYAQKANAARQSGFMQNLQSQLGNLNLEAGNDQFNFNQGATNIDQNAKDYAGSEALWRATNPTAAPQTYTVPGASGAGSTPIKPQTAAATAAAYGYAVNQSVLKKQQAVNFTGARGGHAL